MSQRSFKRAFQAAIGCGVFVTAGSLLAATSSDSSDAVLSNLSPAQVLSLPDTSELDAEQKLDFKWRLHMSGYSYNQGPDNAQLMQSRATAKLDYHFNQQVWTHMIINVSFDDGHVQTLNGDLTPHNKIYPTEISANWMPTDYLLFKGGALSQSYEPEPDSIDVNLSQDSFLLFDHQTFPAAQESYLLHGEKYKASFTLEQAIPTSTTLADNAMSQEPLPRYASETLRGSWRPADSVKLNGWLTHFSFFNLPAVVAQDSEWGGNDVSGDQNAYFNYPFQGVLVGLSGSFVATSSLDIALGAHYLQNFLAPNGLNGGRLAFVGANYHLNPNLDLQSTLNIFRLESDASPAYYNSFGFGHNNRIGQGAEVEMKFRKLGFKVGLQIEQTTPIVYGPYQEYEQFYLFFLESNYASI